MGIEEKHIDDASLVEKAMRGDRGAFDVLMQRHLSKCYRIARRFGLSAEDAADVVQDTFFAAYKALPRFNFSYRFSTWLTRILINRLSNFRRALRRAQRLFSRSEDIESHERIFEESAARNPHQDAEQEELHAALATAVKKLPHAQQVVFVLFEIEGFKAREIAAILDIPEGTVMSRLHHARLALRQRLQSLFEKRRFE